MLRNKKVLWNLKIILFLIFIVSCNKKIDNQENSSVANDTSATDEFLVKETEKTKSVIIDTICEGVVYQILESSDRYKEITDGLEQRVKDNYGNGYNVWLDASPYYKDAKNSHSNSFSEHFEFSIHEDYEDRAPRVASFEFAPENGGKLYEYDIVNDSLIAISFDKKLLSQLYKNCK
jgi:hypothetical protein